MRRVSLAGGIALALIGGLVSAAPTASAALGIGWSPASGHQFTTDGTPRSLPNDVIDSIGDSTMAYYEASAGGAIMAASYSASSSGGDWSTASVSPVKISNPAINYVVAPAQPQLVVNGHGDVTAAWLQQDGSGYQVVWTSTKAYSGTTWSSPQPIDVTNQNADASDVHLAVAGNGTVTVTWVVNDPNAGTPQVYSAMDVGGTWTGATELSDHATETNGVGGLQIAGDRAGNFIALWVDDPGKAGAQVMGKTFGAGGSWTATPVGASANTGMPSDVQVVADGVGKFAVLWLRDDTTGGAVEVEATDLGLDTTTWAGASHKFISNAGNAASSPQLADDGYGDAVAVWLENVNTHNLAYTARRDVTVGNTWTEASSYLNDSNAIDAIDPQIAIDWWGNAIAVWAEGSPAQLLGGVRKWNSTYWSTDSISNPFSAATSFTLASGGIGNYSVFWQQPVSSNSEIFEGSYDNAPPYVWLPSPRALFLKGARVRVAWKGYDWSAIKSYNVIQEVAPWNGRFGQWTYWKQGVTATSARHSVKPGRTYCFKAGATDALGNGPKYLGLNCVTTPVDDPTASVSPGWSRVNISGFYRGTASVTTLKGARMTLTGMHAKNLALLVATGPGNGRIKVLWNGHLVGRHSLAAPKNQQKVVIDLKRFRRVKKGTLTIVVISGGKPVRIDGIYSSKL